MMIPRIRWLPVHLFTAIVMLLVAGALIWVNLQGENVSIDHLTNEPKTIYGWPSVAVERYSAFYMKSDYAKYDLNWATIGLNALCAGVILALTAAFCEFLIRGPRRFQIHLSTAVLLMLTVSTLGWVNTLMFVHIERLGDFEYVLDPEDAKRFISSSAYQGELIWRDDVEFKIFSKGWPYPCLLDKYKQKPLHDPTIQEWSDRLHFRFKPDFLAMDIAFALFILCSIAIASEMLIRRGFSVVPLIRALRLRARYIVYWAINCFIADVSLEQGERKSSSDV